MTVDEDALDEVTRRVHRQIYDRHGKADYVTLRALIRRFMENNREADPLAIDWLSHYDPSLTYDELVEVFRRAYPMYRWGRPEEISEDAFKKMKEEKVEEILRELDEEAIEILRRKLAEMTKPEEAVQQTQQVEERAAEEKPKGLAIDLATLAKYPYLGEYRELISAWTVEEIGISAAARAKERIIEALERGEKGVTVKLDDPLVEALSFAAAKILCLAARDEWLLRRWALAEAARIERLLMTEDEETFLELVRRTKLNVETSDLEYFDYRLRLVDYLTNARRLVSNPEWRLVNRTLKQGWVYLKKSELARLARERLAEHFTRYEGVRPKLNVLPDHLREAAEEAVKALISLRSKYYADSEEVAAGGEWPPCMLRIKEQIADAGHAELFALAAYLINKGYGKEQILALLSARPDYDERIATYQVEHIAGERGSRIKYKPPSCEKMRALGLCVEDGRLCPKGIRNPLQYRATKPRPGPQPGEPGPVAQDAQSQQ